MFKANVKLGGIAVQVEADSIKELIQGASFFTEVPSNCGHCGKGNVLPHHRQHDGNDFYELVCSDCKHTLSFGQHKTGGTLFVKNEWKPPFRKEND